MAPLARPSSPPGRTGPVRTRRDLESLVTPIAGTLALLVVVVAALLLGRSDLDEAKQIRLEDRRNLVTRFDQTGDTTYRTDLAHTYEAPTPFSPDDRALNDLLLTSVRTGPSGQVLAAAFLVDAEGEVVGSAGPTQELPPGVLDGHVEEALSLGGSGSDVFELGGQPVWAVLNPVGGDEPWGALVMVEPLRDGWLTLLYSALGTVGEENGGLLVLDRAGVVAGAWDPALVGTVHPRPPEPGVTPRPTVRTIELDGEPAIQIATASPGGFTTLLYEETEASLFGDLVDAQHRQDLLVVLAAALAIGLLIGTSVVQQARLRRSRRRTQTILSSARDVVLVLDQHDATVRWISPAVTAMLGHQPDDLVGARLPEMLTPDGSAAVEQALAQVRSTGRASVLGVELVDSAADLHWYDLHMVDRPHPELDGVLVTAHEVGDRRALEQQLAHQAFHDPLTGLGNRTAFDRRLVGVAGDDHPFAVLVVDLDRFKTLNDALGHDAGDAALRAVADAMTAGVRSQDRVYRLGGDEFGVIAPGASTAEASALAARLVARIGDAWPPFEDSIGLGASIGVAAADGRHERPETVLREADGAMYRAKLAGGDRHATVEVPAGRPETTPYTASGSVSSDRSGASGPSRLESPTTVDHERHGRRRPTAALAMRAWVTLTTTVVVAVVLIGAGVWQNDRRASEVEAARIADRAAAAQALAINVGGLNDDDGILGIVALTPWPFETEPEVVEFVLELYASAPGLGFDGSATVLDRSGAVVAGFPDRGRPPVDVSAQYWTDALAGRVYTTELRDDGDRQRLFVIIPILARGGVEHVLVLGATPAESNWSVALANLGSLSDGPGGLVVADAEGRALSAWDPDLVGQRVFDPERFPDQVGEHVIVRDDARRSIRIATPIPGTHSPTYAVWDQDETSMFADLHGARATRDGALAAVLTVVVCGLGWTNHRRERQLRREEQLVDVLLQEAHDVVVVTADDLVCRFISAAASRHLGINPDTIPGRPLDEVLGAPACEIIRERVGELEPGDSVGISRVEVPAVDGSVRHFDIELADLRDVPDIAGYLLTCREVGDRTELEHLLARQASQDPLTGLANRARFGSHLDALSERRRAEPGTDAVLFVDLDHFKPVNDEFGHQTGDELLRHIARRLEECVRETDVVCRLGGDEFAVLLVDCDTATATATVERLLTEIRRPVVLDQGVVALDASIGIALSERRVDNAEQLVREADQAMYRAKRAGRGRYVVEP